MDTTGVCALQVTVLGPIGVEVERPAALGGPTQRRVLAVLVLHAGDVVSVDRLVDASGCCQASSCEAIRDTRYTPQPRATCSGTV